MLLKIVHIDISNRNNIIDLDKSSDKQNSCSDRVHNILGDNEYKKLKLKSEGIFFDNQYDVDDEFMPANDFPHVNNIFCSFLFSSF